MNDSVRDVSSEDTASLEIVRTEHGWIRFAVRHEPSGEEIAFVFLTPERSRVVADDILKFLAQPVG